MPRNIRRPRSGQHRRALARRLHPVPGMDIAGAGRPTAAGLALCLALHAGAACAGPDADGTGSGGMDTFAAPSPTLTVSRDTLMASAVLRLHADGLAPRTRVDVGFGPPASEYEVVAVVRSDTAGAVDVVLPVPAWFDPERPYVGVVAVPATGRKAVTDPFRAAPRGNLLAVEGRLTGTTVGCPAIAGGEGTVYALTGDVGDFRAGDEVTVLAAPRGSAACMEALTLHVVAIHERPGSARDERAEAGRR